MAAIDKLYVKDFYEFREFVLWCNAYYPKLLFNMYDPFMSVTEWNSRKENIYNSDLKGCKQFHKRYDINDALTNVDEAAHNYAEINKGFCKDYESAVDEIEYSINLMKRLKDKETYIDEISLPIANFIFIQDKLLKWRCPCECVREYLQKQCGVNPSYEWFYKLFWKGKKEVCQIYYLFIY
jgi:hypothetical protein